MRRLSACLTLGIALAFGALSLVTACGSDSKKVYYGPSGSEKHYHHAAKGSYPQKSVDDRKDRDDTKDRNDTKDKRSDKQANKKKD